MIVPTRRSLSDEITVYGRPCAADTLRKIGLTSPGPFSSAGIIVIEKIAIAMVESRKSP